MHKPYLSPEEVQYLLNELAEHIFRPEGEAVTPLIVFVTHRQKETMQQLSMDATVVLQRWLPDDIKRWQIAKDEIALAKISKPKKKGVVH